MHVFQKNRHKAQVSKPMRSLDLHVFHENRHKIPVQTDIKFDFKQTGIPLVC
jgi:hypothetical protein